VSDKPWRDKWRAEDEANHRDVRDRPEVVVTPIGQWTGWLGARHGALPIAQFSEEVESLLRCGYELVTVLPPPQYIDLQDGRVEFKNMIGTAVLKRRRPTVIEVKS
jgi:hypothetical protein